MAMWKPGLPRRGVFALDDWNPSPLPPTWKTQDCEEDDNGNFTATPDTLPSDAEQNNAVNNLVTGSMQDPNSNNGFQGFKLDNDSSAQASGLPDTKKIDEIAITAHHAGRQAMAKFSYTANSASMLGRELDLNPGDVVNIVSPHEDNPMWVKVTAQSGESGYVPEKYLELEKKTTTLPWLEGKQVQEEAPAGPAGPFKKYKSTYTHEGLASAKEEEDKNYYCEVCDKKLNGPQPYASHMNSKKHKETVELNALYDD